MTVLAGLSDFGSMHPRQETYRRLSEETLASLEGLAPPLMLQAWRQDGLQTFSDGFLWSVDPLEYRDLLVDLVREEQSRDILVLFRTAFGDMVVSWGGGLYRLSITTQTVARLKGSLPVVLDVYLGTKMGLKDLFYLDLFRKARRRLGRPGEWELFGFAPVLALGGDFAESNLHRVELRSHLALLASLLASPLELPAS